MGFDAKACESRMEGNPPHLQSEFGDLASIDSAELSQQPTRSIPGLLSRGFDPWKILAVPLTPSVQLEPCIAKIHTPNLGIQKGGPGSVGCL